MVLSTKISPAKVEVGIISFRYIRNILECTYLLLLFYGLLNLTEENAHQLLWLFFSF